MKNALIFALLLFGFVSCQKSEYKGYSLSPTGLDYKIISLGDPTKTLKDSDMVLFDINVFSTSDSLLFAAEIEKMYSSNQDTGISELLGIATVGDSISAYLNSEKLAEFITISPVQKVRVELGVHSKTNFITWSFYQKYPELSKDLETKEQLGLLRILREFEKDSIEVVNGMFLIRKVVGESVIIKSKDEVKVHYITKTIEGKILDSTYDRKSPFEFIVGQQGQVLKGFDIGIRKMRKGGKATFIVPSALAFGSNGSSTGIAKGYETLVYEVEIVDVSHPEKEIE